MMLWLAVSVLGVLVAASAVKACPQCLGHAPPDGADAVLVIDHLTRESHIFLPPVGSAMALPTLHGIKCEISATAGPKVAPRTLRLACNGGSAVEQICAPGNDAMRHWEGFDAHGMSLLTVALRCG